MSSIIVYGEGNRENRVEYITRDTIPVPNNVYGMSKLQAEQGILALQTEAFKAAVLRPPMIYGKGCKGNYKKLAKLAKITPVFPDMGNRRSMLYIDNLCAFVKWVIDERKQGVCFPQNKEYVNTAQMVREIGRVYKREIRLIKCLNPFVKLFMNRVLLVNKVFGDLVYDKKLTDYGDSEYCVVDFTESIRETEGNTGSLLSRK